MNQKQNQNVGKAHDTEDKGSYQSTFLQVTDLSAREGKTAYIRKEYHESILRILRIVGKDKVTLTHYLDNVLRIHFEQNKAVMEQLYDKNFPMPCP